MSAPVRAPALLTAVEVGAIFRVEAKTVNDWGDAGKLRYLHTPGGHRRYYKAEVDALLRGEPLKAAELDALTGGAR